MIFAYESGRISCVRCCVVSSFFDFMFRFNFTLNDIFRKISTDQMIFRTYFNTVKLGERPCTANVYEQLEQRSTTIVVIFFSVFVIGNPFLHGLFFSLDLLLYFALRSLHKILFDETKTRMISTNKKNKELRNWKLNWLSVFIEF